LVRAEQVLVLRPALRKRVDTQDAAEVLVEAHPAVHTVVALAGPGSPALQTSIDHVCHPAQAKLPQLTGAAVLDIRADELRIYSCSHLTDTIKRTTCLHTLLEEEHR